MQINKVMLYASVLVLISAVPITGSAADKQNDKKIDAKDAKASTKVESKLPIVVEADNLTFSDETGELFAEGNVSVVQNNDKILTNSMRGNSKKTEVWMDGKADFIEPSMSVNLAGTGTHYNYTTRIGSMYDATGMVGHQRVSGKNIDLLPAEMIVHDGTMTECPAKVPDYHVSADKVEIWPGDKMIAYNAKFWIRDTVILSLPKYQRSLKKDAQSDFPSMGYSNSDGFYIKQHIEYPIGDHVAAVTNLGYYTQRGFKPIYGLLDRETNYSLSVMQGDYRDSDGNWIKKEPEFKLDYYSHRLGTLPVSYTFYAIYGKWTDSAKTSWHQDYNLYFAHDQINLTKSLFLNLGTGLERVHESFDGSTRNISKYDSALTKVWSPKFSTTAEYHYTKDNNSLFNYENIDLAREGDLGFRYSIDRMNTIGVRQSYDLHTNKLYDLDYTWYRNIHCWQATITYRAKRHQITWDLATTRW